MRKGKSSSLVTIQPDAETYSVEDEVEFRSLLLVVNALVQFLSQPLIVCAKNNSRKYIKDVKRPKVEEYHNQQQVFFW